MPEGSCQRLLPSQTRRANSTGRDPDKAVADLTGTTLMHYHSGNAIDHVSDKGAKHDFPAKIREIILDCGIINEAGAVKPFTFMTVSPGKSGILRKASRNACRRFWTKYCTNLLHIAPSFRFLPASRRTSGITSVIQPVSAGLK